MTRSGWEYREDYCAPAWSMAGWWRIVLANGEPGNSATKEVTVDALHGGGTEPEFHEDDVGLVFVWANGCRQVWPWSGISRADYQPPRRS